MAEAIPINEVFLHAENTTEEDVQKVTKARLIHILSSYTSMKDIFDYVYRALVERKSQEPLPDRSQRKPMLERATSLGLARAREIRDTDETFPVPLESKDVQTTRTTIRIAKKQDGDTLILNVNEKRLFPFEYYPPEEDTSSSGSDAARVYITLKPEHKGMIAVHFVAICELLRKADISIRAKAMHPYDVPSRYENMLFMVPHEKKKQADEIIRQYLHTSEIGDNEHLPASTDFADGLSWAFEPINEKLEYAKEVKGEDQVSFNDYAAARVLPFYFERLIAFGSEKRVSVEMLKNELKLIHAIKLRVLEQSQMPKAAAKSTPEK